jgi:alkylhydroperoxidase family enzyme
MARLCHAIRRTCTPLARCYGFRIDTFSVSRGADDMSREPRLSPLAPPYAADVAATLESLRMGLPEPLGLFRTLAHSPRVLARVKAGGLLDRGPVPLRLRELVILRTTARCGAGYEWGVHVAGFAGKAGLDEADVRATALASPRAHRWTEPEALALELVDALHDTAHVDDALHGRLAAAFTPDVLVELIALVGFYHLVSFEVNALRIAGEAFAPSLPTP